MEIFHFRDEDLFVIEQSSEEGDVAKKGTRHRTRSDNINSKEKKVYYILSLTYCIPVNII